MLLRGAPGGRGRRETRDGGGSGRSPHVLVPVGLTSRAAGARGPREPWESLAAARPAGRRSVRGAPGATWRPSSAELASGPRRSTRPSWIGGHAGVDARGQGARMGRGVSSPGSWTASLPIVHARDARGRSRKSSGRSTSRSPGPGTAVPVVGGSPRAGPRTDLRPALPLPGGAGPGGTGPAWQARRRGPARPRPAGHGAVSSR